MINEQLEKEYNDINIQRKEVLKELDLLHNEPKVQKYLSLVSRDKSLIRKKSEVYKQMQFNKFANCNHIWIRASKLPIFLNGDHYHVCIKCGLSEKGLFQTEEDCIMHEYMKQYDYQYGLQSDLYCQVELAKAVYTRIKECHPNIDDSKALKYLEIAIQNMLSKDVSDKRIESRTKRLSLESTKAFHV